MFGYVLVYDQDAEHSFYYFSKNPTLYFLFRQTSPTNC